MRKLFSHIITLIVVICMFLMINGCGSEESSTDGDITDGDNTDGDSTDGDITDGDNTDSDSIDVDNTDGDNIDGDAIDGDEDIYVPPQVEGSIETGVGIHIEQQELKLGAATADLENIFGDNIIIRELGENFESFIIADTPISGFLQGSSVSSITLMPGFKGKSTDGLGLGSSRSDVESKIGAGKKDPFLEADWYENHGLVIEWENDAIIRMHMRAPEQR